MAHQSAIQYVRRLKGLEWPEFRKKLSAYLLRRGFSFETVSPLVRQVWDELQPGAGEKINSNGEDE